MTTNSAGGAGSAGWAGISLEHDGLLEDERLDQGYVLFRRDLAQAYGRAAEALEAARTAPVVEPEGDCPDGPLTEVVPDREILKTLFMELRHSLTEHGGSDETMKAMADAAEEDADVLGQLVRLSVFSWDSRELKALAGRLQTPYASVLLTGRLLAVPFMREAVLISRPRILDTTGGEHKSCPNCGSPPAMAVLAGEAGQRRLVCTLCDTSWNFPRMQCPFCDNKDQEKLGVIIPEEDKDRRIEVCDECRRYIKTIDERSIGTPIHPFLEETRTLLLDLLAEHNGYVNRLY